MSGEAGDPADRDRLERLLGVPEMAWFVGRVRDRILAANSGSLTGSVRLQSPTDAQRAAAVKLVGRPRRAGTAIRIDLADVESILRRGPWPAGLADAVVTLTGPVVDRRAERQSEAVAWAKARSLLAASASRFPGLAPWWDEWCLAGGLKRAARAEAARVGLVPGPAVAARLVHDLAKVLDALPASGDPLAVFARRVVGDAHGLDESRPLGRVARTSIGVAFRRPTDSSTELSRRDAWARAGVVMSNVASTVLALGVPGSPGGGVTSVGTATAAGLEAMRDARAPVGTATAAGLEAMRDARAPVVLTLDQVRSGGVHALSGQAVVHVCENPTVVEVVASRWAALPSNHLPDNAPVLVCTSGQPSTAVIELLETLTSLGARCRYHGDFDWAGLRIASVVRSRVPWEPWRYAADDYLEATRQDLSTLALAGAAVDASWDPDLREAMLRTGRAIEEEAVADLLAADLLGISPTPIEDLSPS